MTFSAIWADNNADIAKANALRKAPTGITPHKDRYQSPCFIAKSPTTGEVDVFYDYGAASYWLELIASIKAMREWRLGMRSH